MVENMNQLDIPVKPVGSLLIKNRKLHQILLTHTKKESNIMRALDLTLACMREWHKNVTQKELLLE